MLGHFNNLVKQNVFKPIRQWYRGKEIPIDTGQAEEYGGIPVMKQYETKRHWTATNANTVISFLYKHWQWSVGIAVAILLKVI